MLDWLASVYPLLSAKVLRRGLRELRKTGATELPVPVIRENRPSVQAPALPGRCFSRSARPTCSAPGTSTGARWVSETDLRERAFTLGWNADAVEQVIDNGEGGSVISGALTSTGRGAGQTFSRPGLDVNEQDHLFEIWWSYERRGDELGIPGVYRTVWSGSATRPLKQELMPNAHGRYPFVARPRERTTRQLTESRGLTRPIATHQQEVKVQRDARSNYTQLTASPPYKVAMRRGAFDLIVAPMRRSRWSAWTTGSLPPCRRSCRRRASRWSAPPSWRSMVCRAHGPGPRSQPRGAHAAARCGQLSGPLARCVLAGAGRLPAVFSPAELQRVTGVDGANWACAPRTSAAGSTSLSPSTPATSTWVCAQEARRLWQVAQLRQQQPARPRPVDRSGGIGHRPVLARRTLRPAQNVTQREIDATKNAVTQMAAGIEPDMPVAGINAQLRSEVLQQTVKAARA